MPHRLLSSDHVSRCGGARLPVPPQDSVRSVCIATGDELFEMDIARWRFTTPPRIAQGNAPVYLFCYGAHHSGGMRVLHGHDRQEVLTKLETMA